MLAEDRDIPTIEQPVQSFERTAFDLDCRTQVACPLGVDVALDGQMADPEQSFPEVAFHLVELQSLGSGILEHGQHGLKFTLGLEQGLFMFYDHLRAS